MGAFKPILGEVTKLGSSSNNYTNPQRTQAKSRGSKTSMPQAMSVNSSSNIRGSISNAEQAKMEMLAK